MLDRFAASLAGANADAFVHGEDKDFSVTDFATVTGAAPLDDRCDGGLDKLVVDGDLKLHLPEKVDGDLVAAVSLGMASLSAEALHVEDGQSKDFDFRQRLLDALEIMRLDDRNDEFQGALSRVSRAKPQGYRMGT